MAPNIPGIESLTGAMTGVGGQILYWLGLVLFAIVFFGFLFAIYLFMGYKYKLTIMERRGVGKQDDRELTEHAIGRVTKDRAKQIKDKSGVTKWVLLKSRIKIEPPQFQNIYPGNHLFLYKTGVTTFVPVKFTCDNPSASFSPLPQHIRYWEQLEIRQASEDYQKKNAWDKYGPVVLTMGTVMFCLILVGVTVYYTYQHANGVAANLNGLTETLKGIGNVGGVGPR